MALPPLSTAFRRPGTIRGAVAAGLGADVYPDDLKAEQDNARVQVQRDRLTQQTQRTIQTQQQREADRANKEAEAKRKAELSQEVAKATLVKSTLPSTLTTEQRAKIEKDATEKEGKLKMTAAAAIKAAAEQSPDYGKTTGGIFGWGAQFTPEAQKLREKAARLEDPAAVTDDDLKEARGIMPAPFEEIDKLKGTLSADQEARNKRREADIHLTRAKARAAGVPDEELDSIAPLPKAGAPAVEEDPRTAHFRAVANSGALDRESSALKTHEQTLLRKTQDLQAIQERKTALQQQLSQGVRGPQSARLYQEFQQLSAAEQAHAADFEADREAYNSRAKAFEAKRQMHNERIQQLQEPTAAPKTPKLNATEALSRTLPAVDSTGNEIGRETSQEDTLEALAETGKKAYWSDPKRTEQPDDATRASRTQANTMAVAALQERTKARVEGQQAVRDRIADRLKRGELSVEAAAAEEDRALADYEAQHEADSQAIGSQLGDALDDFQAGKIDSDTLNTVFHAAGSSRTGVEAFKEHLAGQRKDDEHVAALSAVMGGDALAGKGGETLDATTRLAVAKGKAGDEWAFAKDVVKAVATIVTPFMQDDDAKLAAGLAITGKGSDTYTKVQQAKAIQAAAALEKLRTDRRTALAQELTKRGVDVADHARLMARAELETMPADVGVLETIAARGGAESTLRQKMPFIGGLMQAERILPFAETALKLERGEQPAKEEMDALVEFIRFSQREGSGLTKVVDTLTELPAFVTELASTSGIASGVKYAGLKGAKAALQKIVTKEGRELVAKSLAKWTETAGRNQIGKRLALGLGGEALRLPVASAGRIAAGYTRDTALQGVQLSADEGQLVAQIDQNERKGGSHRLADALADSYIENLSERSGGWLGRLVPGGLKAAVSKMAAPVKDKLFKSAVVRALSARNPGMPISKLGAVLAKANFGSTLEEMGEERVGSLARDIWKGISGDGWGVTLPSAEDIGVELVSFMIPGGIGAVQTARHFGKLDSDLKASDAESTAHLQSLTDPKATAERISKLVSTEQRQVTISEQEVTAARDIIGTVDTTDTMRGIDRTTVDLLQRSEQAMEQGDLSRASRLRSMALEQSRARTATADSELIRGLQTVREIDNTRQRAAAIRERAQEELYAAAGNGGPIPAAEQALNYADQLTAAADRASALVKIARGREASLTTAEQTALQASPVPAVVNEGGGMIITDAAREELARVSPAAASYVRQSETERREQLAQSQTQATQAAAQVPAGGATPTAGATPAATSGVGAAQGVAAAPPAGATPATGEWSATGIRGTRVAIPASEASTREEATTKLAQMLKGETLRAGSIQAPKAAAPQNVPANAPVTKPAAQNAVPAKDHGKGAAFDADQWKANATTRIARLAGDQKAFAHATVTVAELHAMLAKVGKVFAGGVEFDNGGPTSGLALDPERQSLAINVQKFAAQTAGLSGQELADFVESRVMHEVIHAAAVDVLTADQIKDLWKRLGQSEAGQKLAKDVQRAYFAAYEARNEKPPALSNFALGHELLRMCIEDKAFAKRISEAQGIDKGFVGELADFLRKISEWLTARINALPKAERATLESYRDNVIAAMEALGVPGVKAEKAPVVVQKLPVREQQEPLTPTDETQNPTIQPPSSAPAPAEPAVQPAAKVDTKPAKKPAAQGKDYSAYTEEQQALLRANDERYASAKRQADAESDAQMRGKLLKAAGMRHAAEFRQITGKLTAKEQQDKDAYEASNHVGKAVSVDGQNGEIVGHAFGRVKVRMGDGAVKNVAPDMIAAPVGDEVVFVAEDLEATPETSNAPDGGQTEGGAVNSPLASETDPGTSSFAPGVQQQSPKKRKKATPKAQEATPTMDAGDKALADAFDGLYANERPVSPFYSKLERVLSAKMPNRADAQTIKGIVSNPQNGIKPEELKWSGLLTWLDGQVQPVAKQTVLDYLGNEGAVRFGEVTAQAQPPVSTRSEMARQMFGIEYNDLDDARRNQVVASMDGRNPKYANYQLPGGENYREVVLAMPGQDHRLSNATFRETGKKWAAFSNADGQRISPEFDNNGDLQTWVRGKLAETGYTSSHFRDVPDYVAHMRTNERTDTDGKPGLFLEEVQSDRHQAGREKGYRGDFPQQVLDEAIANGADRAKAKAHIEQLVKHPLSRDGGDATTAAWNYLWDYTTSDLNEVFHDRPEQAIPDAPFRKDWALAMVKRGLRDAVASGKDFIGWTVGSVQADRFDLSKRLSRISYEPNEDGTFDFQAYPLNDDLNPVISESDIDIRRIEELAGKEIAKKVEAREGSKDADGYRDWHHLRGLDLKVGGQGMTGFYDNILPKEVQKYVKQWGAKVERRDNGLGIHLDPENNGLPYKANATDSPDNMPYWRVDITPAMRASVAEGQALFANERVVLTHSALPADRREAMMKAAATLVDLNLSTPQELAARLDKLAPGGQLRQYTHAFWKIMQGFSDELPDMSKDDWAAIYNPPSTEGNRNTAMIAEAAAKLKGEKQGDKQPSVFPVTAAPTEEARDDDRADVTQTFPLPPWFTEDIESGLGDLGEPVRGYSLTASLRRRPTFEGERITVDPNSIAQERVDAAAQIITESINADMRRAKWFKDYTPEDQAKRLHNVADHKGWARQWLAAIDSKDAATLLSYNNSMNKGSWKVFQKETGIKFAADTDKARRDAIVQFVGAEAVQQLEAAQEAARTKRDAENAAKAESSRLPNARNRAAAVSMAGYPGNGAEWVEAQIADGWTVQNVSTGPVPLYRFKKGSQFYKVPRKQGDNWRALFEYGRLLQEQEGKTKDALPTISAEDEAHLFGKSPVDEAAHEAATSPKNDLPEPTEAQKEAGNYKVGKVRIAGMDISIENPAGSERKGKDANGKAWSVTMADHYGYVRGSEGKDGDHIDIFIAPGTPEDFAGPVFVVNQMTDSQDTAEMRPYRRDDGSVGYQAIPERVFDEHKAIIGPSITTAKEARAEYLKNYSPGWKGAGDVVKFETAAAFREWATEKQRRGPVSQETADKFSLASKPTAADTTTDDTGNGQPDQSPVTPDRPGVAGSVAADEGTADVLAGQSPADVATPVTEQPDSGLSASAGTDGEGPSAGTAKPAKPRRDNPSTSGNPGRPADTGGSRPNAADAPGAGGVVAPQQQPDRANYVLANPDAIVGGGPKARFERNRKAIELYQDLKSSNRAPTQTELDTLAGYMGWGSFGQELWQGNWQRPQPAKGWEREDEWLRNHLGQSEWESAQRSIINAHYTDPPSVQAMWAILRKLGFTGGRVLEPSLGIGNFFGLMPADMAQNSQLTGIELDSLTGGMAQMLYPKANVRVMGYQDSKTADNFYDVVIGNWPFFEEGPPDRRYDKIGATLHDYFFIKALDQVRPGGIVIGITSSGTMDKKGVRSRAEMAKRADLVASFRLPTGAFMQYAGTKVVTDIVILQKRDKQAESTDLQNAGWLNLANVQTPGGEVEVNEYYVAHPEHILGRLNFGHGTTTYRAGMIVDRPDDLLERLQKLPDMLPEGAAMREPQGGRDQSAYITNNSTDRQNAVTEQDGKLFVVNGEHLRPLEDVVKYVVKDTKKTAKREEQLRRLVGIRRALGAVLDAQRKGAENTEALRADLRDQYQSFIKHSGAKSINTSDGLSIMERANDPFAPSLAGLEYLDGKTWKPREIFERNVMRGKPTRANPTISDAYAMARNESLTLDLGTIAKAAGVPVAEVEAELVGGGQVFKTPTGSYEPADVYLSGNVRQKLREAREAKAEGVEGMDGNIAALSAVVPADIPYFQIEANAGATWVTSSDYEDFVRHLLNSDAGDVEVKRVPSGWKVITNNDRVMNKAEATTTWGVPQMGWRKLFSALMNNATVRITYKDTDGVLQTDEKATTEANAKIDAMRDEFKRWLWSDAERTVRLEASYNEVFNAIAIPTYDGSHLAFEGLVLSRGDREFNLRSHQSNAVWRGILTGRGLYAHEVGTGKTLVMAALAMESRRLGKARKPLVLAHNANARQVAAEMQGAYPGAKILFVDNLNAATRQATLNQIALDDWDCVVMPHSIIDRLCLRPESVEAMVREEIEQLEIAAMEAAEEDDMDLSVADMDDPEAIRRLRSPTAKELVKEREKLKNMIEKARQLSEKPDSVFFEDLGVDMLTVDEAHIFKKLPVGTKQKLKGLNKAGSKRGIVLSLLTQHVKRNNGGQGVHLFTGTPITNTLNEVFNMMRYMMDDVMKRDQVDRWDGWFNTFADSTSEVELNSAGEWEAVERLAAFVNLPELRRMIGQYLDIVFADDMPEFKPRTQREGRTEDAIGRPFKKVINEIAPMTHAQKRHKEDLSERYQRWKNMTGRERVKAMRVGAPEVPIIIEGEGVKAAIDMRLIDRSMPEAQDGKIARALNNVMKHYAEHEKSTQMIFMQTGFSDFAERSTGQRTPDGKPIKIKVPVFNVAKDIKRQLIERGIPAHQIAIFSDMDAEERKIAAEQMQRGEIRVAIGSTETMGTGVNAQNELRAMHHIDAPWMPGDLEQRNGRGWRQGNRWNTVLEYRYITEGSHDGRRWQILLTKDRFIKRFMKADDSMRVIEGDGVQLDDEGGGGFEETFSAAAGDPRILQREKLSKDVNKLLDKQRRHFQAIEQAKATVRALKGKIERAEGRVPKLEADKAAYEKAKEEPFSLTLGKKTFTEREEADNAFLDLLDAIPSDGESRTVGSYRGFPIVIRRTQNAGNTTHWYDLRGQLDHAFQSKSTASMDYTLRSIADKIEREQRDISESQASLTSLAKMADTPFGQQADLERKEKMLADIIADLAANPIPAPSWLRNGAPVGTSVWVDGKEYGVAGHKANASGFQVILEGANGELRTVDFKEVQNETGLSVFEAPGEDVPDESPEVPAKPRIDSTRLLDVDKADRGLWRQREKLRAILNKLESQEETDLRAVRIANVTKALKRVEDQLLANSEGGLSANARPALGRGLGAMLGKDTAQVPQIPGVKESLTVATEQRLLTAYAKLDRTGQGYIRIPDLAREAGLSPKEASAVLGRLDSAGKAFLTPADEPRNIPAADLPYLVSGPSGKALYVTLPAEVFDYLVRSGETFSTGRDKSEGDTLAATERPSQPSDGVVAALQVLAENDELFRYPVSHSSTLQTVVKEVAPWVKYLGEDTRPDELQESGADHRHVFENLDGQVFYVYLKGRSRDGEVWIDVSRLEEGDRGAGIYAAIGNYAFNTKRTFIGDPAGLSDAATIRRTSNMLSLALRFGSTDFMEPSASQMRGIPGNNVPPLQWTGSDEQKTRALIDTFLGSLYAQQPGLKDFRYDFDSMHFIDAQGRPLGPDGFAKFGRTSLARKAKAGPATARRGVFLQSLVSEAGGTGPDLLQAIRSRGREIVLNGGLGSLFSTERPLRDDPEMAALLDALNAPFSDEQRADLYSRAGFDWGRDMTEAEARQIAENARAGSRSYYDLQRDEQTHEAWNTAAREMLARDQRGAIKELVSDAVSGNLGRNAVKVKAAQLAIPGMMVAAIANKDKQAFRDAEALTYAYDVAGTETARGLAARWKPHQTAEDAHREMLAKMIFTPSAKDRAKIERAVSRAKKNDKIKALEAEIAKVKAEANDWANAVLRRAKDQTEAATAREREIAKRFQGELITKFEEAARAERAQAAREVLRLTQELRKVQDQKDKQQLISEANEKRLAEIEQALADMGVTFHDIFVSKEAIVRLRGSALVKNVLKPLNEKERMAIKSRLEGRTDRQIARETGISERSLAGVFSQFDTALKAQISTWVDRGFSIADFEMLDSAGNRVDVGNLIDDQGNLLAANVRAANLTAEEKAARIDGIFSAIVPATKARNSGALKRVTGSQPAAPYGFDISRPEHAVVLARAIARLDSSGADMVYEYWINGLLSGPATHFANLTGNTGNAALEYAIQRPLEAITNAVLFRDAAGASLGEYKSMAKWTQRAFSNAWAFAKTAWDTEVSLFDSQWLDKPIQLRGSSGDKGQIERFAIPGKFGRVVRTPSRTLQFTDEFAKHFFGMLEASAQAHRLARADGLTGKALDARVEQLVSVPGSPAWIAAVDKAHRLTFTNDLPAPLQRAQDIIHERADTAIGSTAKMLMRFVFPFVRTPYNIFATGMRKTPLGSLRMGWKAGVGLVDSWKGNQAFFESYPKAALAGDIAEQLLAWTTALLLAGAAEGDPDDDKKLVLITGTRSIGDNRGEAQLLNRIRGGETSIIVNGQPVLNYGRIEPFATIISTIVDAARELKKINGGEPAVKAFENAARNLVDQARSKTFLQGFDGLMQLLDGRVKSMPGAAVKFIVTGAVPNLVRQPLRNVDDFARDSRNASWYYQALPFGGFAEPLYDLYGRPMEKGETSVSRILTGNSNARVQPRNPADTALDRWNKDNEGDPQQKYFPVNPSVFRYKDAQGQWKDMTAQEIARFRRVAGQNFAQEAIQTFMVPRAPQKEEMRTLESVNGKTYDKAKDALFGGGVSAPMPKRQPPTLKELFGQSLRK
jgi:N12 class adenine-specific DNA methylase